MSGNILILGNRIFKIPQFFQTRLGDLGKKVHTCSLRFSALKVAAGFSRRQKRENPGNEVVITGAFEKIL